MDRLLRKDIKRHHLLTTEIIITGDVHVSNYALERPEKPKKGDIFLYKCSNLKNSTHVKSLLFNGSGYKNIDLSSLGIEKNKLNISLDACIEYIITKIKSQKGSIALYRNFCYRKKVSKCFRCGYCCIDYDVVISRDEGNELYYKMAGLPCPNLRWDSNGFAICIVHDEPWFIETPCFTYNEACNDKQCNTHESRKKGWYKKYYREFSVEEYIAKYDKIAHLAERKKLVDAKWFNPNLTPFFFPK